MEERRVTLPVMAAIAATRGMLGLGAGLLLADKIDRDHRKLVGLILVGIGALSTVPLALRVLRRQQARVTETPRPRSTEPRMVH
jgi:hypothetical protein